MEGEYDLPAHLGTLTAGWVRPSSCILPLTMHSPALVAGAARISTVVLVHYCVRTVFIQRLHLHAHHVDTHQTTPPASTACALRRVHTPPPPPPPPTAAAAAAVARRAAARRAAARGTTARKVDTSRDNARCTAARRAAARRAATRRHPIPPMCHRTASRAALHFPRCRSPSCHRLRFYRCH